MRGHQFTTGMMVVAMTMLCGPMTAHADVVVIGHHDSAAVKLTPRQAADLFLGKTSKLPDGTRVEMTDQAVGTPARDAFYQEVAHKNEHQLRAYWAKRIFAGKGSQPDMLATDAAVINWVSAQPGRIGYVSTNAATDNVTVLLQTKTKP